MTYSDPRWLVKQYFYMLSSLGLLNQKREARLMLLPVTGFLTRVIESLTVHEANIATHES